MKEFPLLMVGVFLLPATALCLDIRFNTDTGQVTRFSGSSLTAINGTPIGNVIFRLDGVTEFQFLGDLVFLGVDQVDAVGSRPLSLHAGNDVLIAAGAVLDFDAPNNGSIGPMGGGRGGGTGGRISEFGGTGGGGGQGMPGGPGGPGAVTGNGFKGGDGTPGVSGNDGSPGESGFSGIAGTGGFSNPSGGGMEGAAGTPGVKGLGGGGGSGDTGGDGGILVFDEVTPVPESGDPGIGGSEPINGGLGGVGGTGGSGRGGLNEVIGNLLSAGGGGGGGGSGGSGAGGGGGGGSGGGAGGGGGAAYLAAGKPGGKGGSGASGGAGGQGGPSGFGGGGGSGGGAVEIVAQGVFNFGGTITARGGNGLAGDPMQPASSAPTKGMSRPGDAGPRTLPTLDPIFQTIIGGGGGQGLFAWNGADGGAGGMGGAGGGGGAGAGGTIRFQATLIDAVGGSINTSGGAAGGSAPPTSNGGDGRYVVALDNTAANTLGLTTGTRNELYRTGGAVNPYLLDGGNTSNIPGLVGGADTYGVLDGLNALDAFFAAVREHAPAGAVMAVVRAETVPNVAKLFQQDALLLVNLTASTVTDPQLGVTSATSTSPFAMALKTRGFAKNPAFGGAGPTTLAQIDGGEVYATLIPDTAGTSQIGVNVAINGGALTKVVLNNNADAMFDAEYLVSAQPRFDVRRQEPMNSAGAVGNVLNSRLATTYRGSSTIFTRLSFRGELTKAFGGTFASNSRFNITSTSGGAFPFQPTQVESFDGTITTHSATSGLFFANALDEFAFESFESFNDGPGVDAVHSGVMFSFDGAPLITDLGDFSPGNTVLGTQGTGQAPKSLALYSLDGDLISSSATGLMNSPLTSGEFLLVVGALDATYYDGAAYPGSFTGTFRVTSRGAVIALGVHPGGGYATFSLTVTPGLPGDYNDDGRVDAADYVVWRDAQGRPSLLPNDLIGGVVGSNQYNAWRSNYGAVAAPTGPTPIPEPTSLAFAILSLAPFFVARCRS